MIWVTLWGKEPQSAEVLSEGKVNMERVVEEGSYKYQLWPYDKFQNEEFLFLITKISVYVLTKYLYFFSLFPYYVT